MRTVFTTNELKIKKQRSLKLGHKHTCLKINKLNKQSSLLVVAIFTLYITKFGLNRVSVYLNIYNIIIFIFKNTGPNAYKWTLILT